MRSSDRCHPIQFVKTYLMAWQLSRKSMGEACCIELHYVGIQASSSAINLACFTRFASVIAQWVSESGFRQSFSSGKSDGQAP